MNHPFTINNDYSVTSSVSGETVREFTPIGRLTANNSASKYFPYVGVFDGNGYEIRNLYINSDTYVGLFRAFEGTLKNLTIASGLIKSTGNYAGAFAGSILQHGGYNNTTIVEGCCNKATVRGGDDYASGIVGLAGYGSASSTKSLTIKNCVNEGKVVANSQYVGGLIGLSKFNWHIDNCLNKGELKAASYTGGFVGQVNNTFNISNSLNVYVLEGSHVYAMAGKGPAMSSAININNTYSISNGDSANKIWYKDSTADITYTGWTYSTAADLATIDMAYTLNDNTSGETYANSGAWTFNTGDAYPTLADSVNGGVYKLEIKNGSDVLNTGDTYVKSTTGTAQLIASANYGTSAVVTPVNLKTTKLANVTLGTNWKVMLWDSFDTLKPLRGAIVAQ